MSHRTYRNFIFTPKFLTIIFSLTASLTIAAQSTRLPDNLPIWESNGESKKMPVFSPSVATGNDLYCAGYISAAEVRTDRQIVGGEEETHVAHFGQGDIVYINIGRAQNIQSDMLFAIIRPMGKYHSPYHRQGGKTLGTFVRELGVLRVIAVQEKTATARVIVSCDDIQFGDVLVPFENRQSPTSDIDKPLPRYKPSSGKNPGRIVMQRDQKEVLAPRDVVYIDLGAENGVKTGDKFTIFRNKPDDANILNFRDDDVTIRQSGGYESDKFKGGKFSSNHPYVARQKVKDTRPTIPQKIVGELVVIAVQGKSATAIVTRTTQEAHTGDRIEALQ